MKKYIKPEIITRSIAVPAIMAGSLGDVQGEYKGGPLKSKAMDFYENDEVSIAEDETPL